ncbi:MAG: pilus assembly protein FimV [Cycloclasticus sp.]|nr:MAG: pilus assembly protein FimV [Cycloclasticus sp.]
MKKSTKTIAALCLLNSANIYALGVGEIETHSALNQNLKATIPLVGSKSEDPSNLLINIGSKEAFARAGIDRPHYLTQLKFTPILEKNGSISIDVTSNSTIKEPFLNFIIEVEWPQGRTLKEFTILLDPPVSLSEVRTTPIELAKSRAITPVAPTSLQVSSYVAPSLQAQAVPAQNYGPVKNGDTVWGIAKQLIENDHTVTHEQMMLALFDNNPSAFYKDNINALKKGAILQMPSKMQVTDRSSGEALNEYINQNNLWSSSTNTKTASTEVASIDDTTQQTASTDSDSKKKVEPNVEEAKLTLLTPDQTNGETVMVDGNSVDTPVTPTNTEEQANLAMEMATTLEQENQEVKSRLSDLETQVEKLQRLLALKDEQLAQLQTAEPVAASPKPETVAANATAAQSTPDNEEESSLLPYAGGGLLIALLGFLFSRRKAKGTPFEEVQENTPTPTPTPTENQDDEDLASTTDETSSDIDVATGEQTEGETQDVDPLTEADLLIASGQAAQAEELLQNEITKNPDELSFKLKLIDLYFNSRNSGAFEELAMTLTGLKASNPQAWETIAEMGAEICPDSTLFLVPLNEDIVIEQTPADNSNDETSDKEAETTNDEFEFDFDVIKNDALADNFDQATEADEETDGAEQAGTTAVDISNSDNTNLSLAQAYIDMDDTDSARSTLEEVLETGSDEDKELAEQMLNNL